MNLPNGETGVDLIQLVAAETEVLFHARDVCISKVGAVELRVGQLSVLGEVQARKSGQACQRTTET